MSECFFAHLGGCEGRLVKAHLVPKQTLRRELRYRGTLDPEKPSGAVERWLHEVIWDERCWRWMCGGPTGLGGHHGQYDAKQVRIPREQVPPDLVAFLAEHGLEWMVDKYLGER